METTVMKVQGMTCSGCVASVKRVLEGVDGVASADVSLEAAQAVVRHDPVRAKHAALKQAVEEAGFDVA